MSLDVLTAIWKHPPCKGGDLLCLLAIADNADDLGYAWPSIQTIARKAAMSERGAQKCVAKLVNAGLVTVEIGGGRGKSNAYQITTNGIGETLEHKNPEQYSPNTVHPLGGINPERCDINPEQSDTKPRTPVHPNSQEPSIEPSESPLTPQEILETVLRPKTARDFIASRKAMKKPVTDVAAERIVSKLENCPDPDAVVDESIANGWQGVFPERSKPNGRQSERQKFDIAHREYTRRIAAGEIQRGPDPSDPFAGG